MNPHQWLTAATLLALLAGPGCAATPPAAEGAMAVSSQTARELIPFTDQQINTGDAGLLDALMRRLSDTDFDGLLLRAPERVAIYEQAELPVILASKETILRAWQVMPAENLVLIATDLDSGRVRVGRALVDPKEAEANFDEEAPRPPRPNATAAAGTTTSARRLDARVLLNLPWEPAHLRLAALSLDRASNTASVTLDAPLARFSPPPVRVDPPPAPGDGLPGYRQRQQSPALPQAGATFELYLRGQDLLVAGAFTIPAREAHLGMPEADARAQGIAALVPATIALMRLDGRLPWLIPLTVPVYGPQPASLGDPLTGWFSVDATAQLGHPLPPGNYAAWVVFEGVPLGPRRFGLAAP